MKQELKEIEINGVCYIPKSESKQSEKAQELDGMKYVIIRTYSAGVHAGYLEKREGQEATLRKSRRIWYWEGAASLSQLAVDGTSLPEKCKFPCEVDSILLLQCIEIIDCTAKAKKSIEGVKIWEQ